MTQANSSLQRSPDASGVPLATHIAPDGKEYAVVINASHRGHLEASLPSYLLTIPPQAVGANKLHFDFFNADASKVVKIRGAWVFVAQDTANTATVSTRLDWFRTSSVGTGGTAAQYDANTIVANITPKDTANPALPAGVTARTVPTAGAALDSWMFPTYHQTEETQIGGALSQWNNVLPNPERGEQEITLNQNQGILCRQGTVAGVGNIGFLVSFTVE